MQIISKTEAESLGLKRFFTGEACRNGHTSERLVSSGICCDCSIMYNKRWETKNPEQVKLTAHLKHVKRYYKDGGEKERNRVKKYRENNPDKVAQTVKKYVENNRALINEKARIRSIELRKSNPELVKFYIDDWWKRNKHKKKVYHRNRKSRKRNNGGIHTAEDISSIFSLQKGCCAYCKIPLGRNHHVDHIVPLCLGGTNDRRNLQLLCVPCNLSKGRKDPIDYARHIGMLL